MNVKKDTMSAFVEALHNGTLSHDNCASNCAHNYRYMFSDQYGDKFKHVYTRQYVTSPNVSEAI